jgi:hypothetical protein
MHEKYVVLHFSYSAPVRVSDIVFLFAFSVAARDTTDFCTTFVALRDDTERALFDRGCCAVAFERFVVFVALRGVKTDVFEVLRFGVVATRDCDTSLPDFERDTLVPSRTAASAIPAQINKFSAKIRIFFISDEILANL